jgi:putative restriction endonuclease
MGNYSRLDKVVWDDFFDNMENYLTPDSASAVVEAHDAPVEFVFTDRVGLDVLRLTKTRVNQSFFRSMVLTSYDNKCALTGIDAPELLVASHIRPWALDPATRTNPRNGICLNTLHDRAFDEGLITFDEDLSVRYSPTLPTVALDALTAISEAKLRLPSRFLPDGQFLNYHRTEIFKAAA